MCLHSHQKTELLFACEISDIDYLVTNEDDETIIKSYIEKGVKVSYKTPFRAPYAVAKVYPSLKRR